MTDEGEVETHEEGQPRRVGRPREPGAKRTVLAVRLREETAEELGRVAKAEGVSRGELARRILEEGLSGRP